MSKTLLKLFRALSIKKRCQKVSEKKTEDNKDNLQVKRNHIRIWDLINSTDAISNGTKPSNF